MSRALYLERRLLQLRSKSAREAIYKGLAGEFGKGFADSMRDMVEAHHMIVENEREINRLRRPVPVQRAST